MKKILSLLMILMLVPCAGSSENGYNQISHEEAQKMMASNPDALIVDVRTPEEYEQKHIPNSLLVPLEDLKDGDFSKLPDKDATLLIYCRTGRRSKEASQILVDNGYKKIYEFGGIVDWKGEVTGTDIKQEGAD